MGCCSGRCALIFLCTFQLVSGDPSSGPAVPAHWGSRTPSPTLSPARWVRDSLWGLPTGHGSDPRASAAEVPRRPGGVGSQRPMCDPYGPSVRPGAPRRVCARAESGLRAQCGAAAGSGATGQVLGSRWKCLSRNKTLPAGAPGPAISKSRARGGEGAPLRAVSTRVGRYVWPRVRAQGALRGCVRVCVCVFVCAPFPKAALGNE